MTLLCTLLNHATGPHMLRNQGFAFSICRRCGRDMIRSVEPPATKWRVVPTGFRVAWRNTDLNQSNEHRQVLREFEEEPGPSLISDFLYVTTAALYWKVRDYLYRPIHRKKIILRISGS
jgi:hypothetical protein